jgi:hypothetical protein
VIVTQSKESFEVPNFGVNLDRSLSGARVYRLASLEIQHSKVLMYVLEETFEARSYEAPKP